MKNKKITDKDIIIDKEITEEHDLDEMPLEEMDFDVAKKIISDYLSEEVPIDEDEVERADVDNFVVLEVQNLEVGLKMASEILELPIIKIRYKILKKYFKEIDGKIVEHFQVEFKEKAAKGISKVKISEDKLTAYFSVVYPESLDGKETTYQDLLDLIKRSNITFGIKFDKLKDTISSLKENYDALTDVLIAEGKAPAKGVDSELEFSVFSCIKEIDYVESRKIGLDEIFACTSLDFIKEKYFPVRIVKKGELHAVTTIPGKGEKGTDVFGNELEEIKGSTLFQDGKNGPDLLKKYLDSKPTDLQDSLKRIIPTAIHNKFDIDS